MRRPAILLCALTSDAPSAHPSVQTQQQGWHVDDRIARRPGGQGQEATRHAVAPHEGLEHQGKKRGRQGERQGPEEWQYHHWKAVDAAQNCKKREYTSIARSWRDDASYRDTQQKHGGSLEYFVFLDHVKKIPISYRATQGERNRYKNIL